MEREWIEWSGWTLNDDEDDDRAGQTCCDLLTAAFNCPPTTIAIVRDSWVVGDAVCQLNGVLTTLLGVASVMTLFVMSSSVMTSSVMTLSVISLNR